MRERDREVKSEVKKGRCERTDADKSRREVIHGKD